MNAKTCLLFCLMSLVAGAGITFVITSVGYTKSLDGVKHQLADAQATNERLASGLADLTIKLDESNGRLKSITNAIGSSIGAIEKAGAGLDGIDKTIARIETGIEQLRKLYQIAGK